MSPLLDFACRLVGKPSLGWCVYVGTVQTNLRRLPAGLGQWTQWRVASAPQNHYFSCTCSIALWNDPIIICTIEVVMLICVVREGADCLW